MTIPQSELRAVANEKARLRLLRLVGELTDALRELSDAARLHGIDTRNAEDAIDLGETFFSDELGGRPPAQ